MSGHKVHVSILRQPAEMTEQILHQDLWTLFIERKKVCKVIMQRIYHSIL